MKKRMRFMLSAARVLLAAAILVAPLAAHAHGKHPKAAKRSGECSKPSQQTERIARHTSGYAVERFNLKGLAAQSDFVRAGKHMNNFLRWKLGGAVAVCAQYVTGSYSHFEKAYSDEAAAMALGILQFNRQQLDLKLPNWYIAYLNFSYDLATLGTTGIILEKIGLGNFSGLNKLREMIYDQTSKPIFDAVVSVAAYVPKSFDIDNRFVHEAIKARQYSAQGLAVMRRDWATKASARTGGGRLPQFGKKRNLPGGGGPDIGKGMPGSGRSYDPDAGDSYDPTGDQGYCPGNQLLLPDGSCGCDVNEIQQGDNCMLAGGESGGLPYVENQAPQMENYQDGATGMEEDRRIQGETPYYER